jgi:uncharacterized protein with HEPN domain
VNNDRLYLLHILECIGMIEAYTSGGESEFLEDRKTQDAVLRNLQVLAESCQRLSLEIKTRHLDIEWKKISGFRNVIVHGYLGVKMQSVWGIVVTELSPLKLVAERMLAGLPESPC